MYSFILFSFVLSVLSEKSITPTAANYPQVTSIQLELNGTPLPYQVYHASSWNTNLPIPGNTVVMVDNKIVAKNLVQAVPEKEPKKGDGTENLPQQGAENTFQQAGAKNTSGPGASTNDPIPSIAYIFIETIGISDNQTIRPILYNDSRFKKQKLNQELIQNQLGSSIDAASLRYFCRSNKNYCSCHYQHKNETEKDCDRDPNVANVTPLPEGGIANDIRCGLAIQNDGNCMYGSREYLNTLQPRDVE